jgi:two-component system, OmpR family, response regulator CssR
LKVIYVVDDEKDLLSVIKLYLERAGYIVETFSDAESALARINDEVHLWLLDIMLKSDISGYDLIKIISERNPKPVIFMSARDQELDRIMGLEMGCDDYITKPFSMREMVLRVNNVFKHSYGTNRDTAIIYKGYNIDVENRMIMSGDVILQMTSKETDMVLFLLKNKGMPFSRDQLLNKLWEQDCY